MFQGQMAMLFSIIIPARNEAANIGACLDSIDTASRDYVGQTEVIVVLNHCTDCTEDIALRRGATVVNDDSRNLSRIRNTGARHASGTIIITIDADSVMSANMLVEVDKALQSEKYIGGGVPILPERMSLGILLSGLLLLSVVPLGISAGMFWLRRSDFNAIGGFDESLIIAEDIDFAERLRAYGKERNRRFGTLRRTHITTSCRKFDRFGDWHLVLRPWLVWRAIQGQENGLADEFFYDFER